MPGGATGLPERLNPTSQVLGGHLRNARIEKT